MKSWAVRVRTAAVIAVGLVATPIAAAPSARAQTAAARASAAATPDARSLNGGLSCPAVGSCVAIGNVPYQLQGSTWQVGPPLQFDGLAINVNQVSCPAPGWCALVGNNWSDSPVVGVVGIFEGGSWTLTSLPISQLTPAVGPGGYVSPASISCPLVGWCTVVGSYVTTADDLAHPLVATLANGSWTAVTAPLAGVSDSAPPSNGGLGSVSCASVGECMAVGGWSAPSVSGGLIEQLTAAGWQAATAPPSPGYSEEFPGAASPDLSSVVCASISFCVAVAYDESQVSYVGHHGPSAVLYTYDTDNGFRSQAWTVAKPPLTGLSPAAGAAYTPGAAEIESLACPIVGVCVAVGAYDDAAGNQYGLIETLSEGRWHARTAAPAPGMPNLGSNPNVFLHGVTCATSASCVAVGNYGGAAGGAVGENFIVRLSHRVWTSTTAPLPPGTPPGVYTFLGAVSCPTPTWCVAGGQSQIAGALFETFDGTAWTPFIAT